jgi:hypothetical protein
VIAVELLCFWGERAPGELPEGRRQIEDEDENEDEDEQEEEVE